MRRIATKRDMTYPIGRLEFPPPNFIVGSPVRDSPIRKKLIQRKESKGLDLSSTISNLSGDKIMHKKSILESKSAPVTSKLAKSDLSYQQTKMRLYRALNVVSTTGRSRPIPTGTPELHGKRIREIQEMPDTRLSSSMPTPNYMLSASSSDFNEQFDLEL
mmetsp:Transcript_22023/g.32825  ORF Transcript_22023/g.32825 Transcript_22023/m.32825 type:complete len:160 (-) Transcript_22023:292-771(-)